MTTNTNSSSSSSDTLKYQVGFGNALESEAVEGALIKGRNTPKKVPLGLYTEQLSGTAFTRPRNVNQRTWLYRQQPPVIHNIHKFQSTRMYFGQEDPAAGILDPNPLRWQPFSEDDNLVRDKDFVSGMHLLGAAGDPSAKNGLATYVYLAGSSMHHRHLCNSDGDFLILPQQGTLDITTELGKLQVAPGELCVIPRGIVFQVHLNCGDHHESGSATGPAPARGYVLEIFKGHFSLPELGPIGSNGLANARDFQYPVAWYEQETAPTTTSTTTTQTTSTLLNKFGSQLWSKPIVTSPYNVVAWHGNYLPFKYDLAKFCAVNSVTYDHLDPSIYTVLTVAGDEVGTALVDFVIFPPRWMSTDANTFRPPWFHRNYMTEFMGLLNGTYDAKTAFQAGGASLHSCMTPHGPDSESYAKNIADSCETPTKFDGGLAFMFETPYILKLSKFALHNPCLEDKYGECWEDLPNEFVKNMASVSTSTSEQEK